MRSLNLLAIAASVVLAVGCAPAEEEEESASASGDALSLATSDYESTLADIERAYAQCEREGRCRSDSDDDGTSIGTKSVQPLAAPKRGLLGTRLCSALKPLARFESPYFFAGMNINVSVFADDGANLVFDLRNMQAALFRYHGRGYSDALSAEVSAHVGYAFGNNPSVVHAWSGSFQSAGVLIDLPFPGLSAGVRAFRSRDNSMLGGAVEGSFGLNALGPLDRVEIDVNEGEWTAWDAATRAYGKSLYLVGYREGAARVGGRTHAYVQFDGAKDLGVAVVQSFGTTGFAPAAQAAALAALRKAKLTIGRACP